MASSERSRANSLRVAALRRSSACWALASRAAESGWPDLATVAGRGGGEGGLAGPAPGRAAIGVTAVGFAAIAGAIGFAAVAGTGLGAALGRATTLEGAGFAATAFLAGAAVAGAGFRTGASFRVAAIALAAEVDFF